MKLILENWQKFVNEAEQDETQAQQVQGSEQTQANPADADKKYLEAVKKVAAELKKESQEPDILKVFAGASSFMEEYNDNPKDLEAFKPNEIKGFFTENKKTIDSIVNLIKKKNVKNLGNIKDAVSKQLERSEKAVTQGLKNIEKAISLDASNLKAFAEVAQSFINVYTFLYIYNKLNVCHNSTNV